MIDQYKGFPDDPDDHPRERRRTAPGTTRLDRGPGARPGDHRGVRRPAPAPDRQPCRRALRHDTHRRAYLESARLPRLVQPFLQGIAAGTHEIAHLAVLDGDDAVYIARSGVHRHMNSGYMLGSRVQAQVTAAGMAILASVSEAESDAWLADRALRAYTPYTISSTERLRSELQRFRRQGWALSEQQMELNYRGLAVPLFDRNNDVQGAISVTMPINQETSADAVARLLPVLKEAARTLRALI